MAVAPLNGEFLEKKNLLRILLQREAGEYRVVTEILDTRDRSVSYQNICKETLTFF